MEKKEERKNVSRLYLYIVTTEEGNRNNEGNKGIWDWKSRSKKGNRFIFSWRKNQNIFPASFFFLEKSRRTSV